MYYLKNKSKRKRPDPAAKLDRVFSEYIRLRDSDGHFFRCISCGEIKPIGQADCGHYFSRRKMSVRWDRRNANAECRACNRFRSDHLIGYRENLIKKIGEEAFNALEIQATLTAKYSEFDIKVLIKYYNDLINELKHEKS